MSDLVKRIRERLNDAPMETERLLDDAADRIERLEAVLAQAKDALECATLHHGLTSLPKKIEHFGSVDAAHDFGRHTWRENIPSAIAAIDAALKE